MRSKLVLSQWCPSSTSAQLDRRLCISPPVLGYSFFGLSTPPPPPAQPSLARLSPAGRPDWQQTVAKRYLMYLGAPRKPHGESSVKLLAPPAGYVALVDVCNCLKNSNARQLSIGLIRYIKPIDGRLSIGEMDHFMRLFALALADAHWRALGARWRRHHL